MFHTYVLQDMNYLPFIAADKSLLSVLTTLCPLTVVQSLLVFP